MAAQELYIKNMVCDRCIWVVRNELERLGYAVAEVDISLMRCPNSILMKRIICVLLCWFSALNALAQKPLSEAELVDLVLANSPAIRAADLSILYPVATVILGGLLSSTLLDVIVTPVVFHQFGKRALETYAKNKKQGQFSTADELAA